MSDEDIFDDVVDDALDLFLTPTLRPNEDSRGVPSGVSSGSGEPKTASPAVPVRQQAKSKHPAVILTCQFGGCKKSYKTQKGYDNHIFTHKIFEINSRRPNVDSLNKAADGLVTSILLEISQEEFSTQEKSSIIADVLKGRESLISEWNAFVQLISKPIIDVLTKRTKLLPHNQYEESLCQLNMALNDNESVLRLKSQFKKLLPAQEPDLKCIGLINFQLFTRLGEELQILIHKEIRQNSISVQTFLTESTPLTGIERKLFCDEICCVVRIYFSKAVTIHNEVWNTRCECIRLRFMTFLEDIRKSDIVKKILWFEGKISVSNNVLDFSEGLECVINRLRSEITEPVTADKVISTLVVTDNLLINMWHALTTGYFSEVDSLLFMRDFVTIIINLSIRLEESRLQRVEAGDKRLQQFATRDNLKRN